MTLITSEQFRERYDARSPRSVLGCLFCGGLTRDGCRHLVRDHEETPIAIHGIPCRTGFLIVAPASLTLPMCPRTGLVRMD